MSKSTEYKKADLIWDIKFFISSFILGFPKELILYAKSIFSNTHTPTNKFAILSTGRTGSTLLVSLLNSNPEVFCDGEILKHRYFNPFKVLKKHAQKSNKKIYGFKLLTHHIKDIQWEAKKDHHRFLTKLIDDGYKIIYLERKQRIDQCLSMMYAILRNDWHKKKGAEKAPKKEMTVDLENLDWWMNGFEELNQFEKKILQNIPHVHVVYEEDLSDPNTHAATVERICNFLEIEVTPPKTSLRKITPKRYEDYITNAKEMMAHLKEGKFAHLLLEKKIDDISIPNTSSDTFKNNQGSQIRLKTN